MRRSLLVLLSVVLIAAGCTPSSDSVTCDPLPGVRTGLCPVPVDQRQPAPDDAVDVLGSDEEQLSLADLRGRVVVVNFWASWCGPCRTEQPDLNDAYRAVPEAEVAFLGVNIEDTETNALAHVREFDIPYPHLFDPSNVYASRYRGIGPRTIPSTIIIDTEGRVAVRVFGVTTAHELLTLIDTVLRDA